ncbi:MAG TPA: cupin domain-containing protein, partial [Chitinivibrionales bacterium]|nr:cupin domain-containing protein [Chitinivibrionales bacterium]
MFYKSNVNGYTQILPGIQIKTLTYGDLTLLTEYRMKKGSALPQHSHVHEQTGYLVKGNVLLFIGNEEYNVTQGDSWCIQSNVKHNAQILSDSVAIEVFAPVREDYLKFKQDK